MTKEPSLETRWVRQPDTRRSAVSRISRQINSFGYRPELFRDRLVVAETATERGLLQLRLQVGDSLFELAEFGEHVRQALRGGVDLLEFLVRHGRGAEHE